jgi:predicted transcriptional regulator
MTAKGLTDRDDHRGQHLYRPRQAEADTLRRLVSDLLEQAFGGSTSKLVLQALATKPASPDELREIRKLLNQPPAPPKKRTRS